jgi:hypothetical protein
MAHVAGEPADGDPAGCAHREDVGLGRHLEEHLALGFLREGLQDGADCRHGGLVAGKQDLARVAGVELEAADRPGTRHDGSGVGADDQDLVTDRSSENPAGRGAGLPVHNKVHVDLAEVGAGGAHGIGAQHGTVGLGQVTPGGVPVIGIERKAAEPGVSGGQHQLDALIRAERGKVGECLTAERHAKEGCAEGLDVGHGDRERRIHNPGHRSGLRCAGGCRDILCGRHPCKYGMPYLSRRWMDASPG